MKSLLIKTKTYLNGSRQQAINFAQFEEIILQLCQLTIWRIVNISQLVFNFLLSNYITIQNSDRMAEKGVRVEIDAKFVQF